MKELNWDGQNYYEWSNQEMFFGEVTGYDHGLILEKTEENSKTSYTVTQLFNFYPLTMGEGSFMLSS